MGQVRYRHGKAADIARARPLLEPDRHLYSPEIWPEVPKMLGDLLARDRIRICVFENAESGEMVCFGVTSREMSGF